MSDTQASGDLFAFIVILSLFLFVAFAMFKMISCVNSFEQNKVKKTYFVEAKILNSEERVLNGKINGSFLGIRGKISDRFYTVGVKIPLPEDAKRKFALRDIHFSVAEKGYYEDKLKENGTINLKMRRNGFVLEPRFEQKELETIYLNLNKKGE